MLKKKITGYDPMTGEPIYENKNNKKTVRYDPMTGEPIYDKGKRPKGRFFGVAIVLVLITLAVFLGVCFLSSPKTRVASAFKNTFEASKLITTVRKGGNILSGNDFNLDIKGESKSYELDLSYGHTVEKKQLKGILNVNGDSFGEDVILELDKDALRAKIPSVSEDSNMIFRYREDTNAIVDFFIGEKLNSIRDALIAIDDFEFKSTDNFLDIEKAFAPVLKKMEVKRVKKRNIAIDGKNRSCKGYNIKVDKDTLEEAIEEYLFLKMDDAGEYFNASDNSGMMAVFGYLYSIDRVEASLKEKIKDAIKGEDANIYVYLYRGKVVYVVIEGKDDIEISLNVGNSGWESFEIKTDEYKFFVEYDTKSGELSFRSGEFKLQANLALTEKDVVLNVENSNIIDLKGEFRLSKNAAFSELKGEEKSVWDFSYEGIRTLIRFVSEGTKFV